MPNAAIDKDRAYVQIRSSYALLKRADELLARRQAVPAVTTPSISVGNRPFTASE
jgi:hypothetical protein